MAAIDKYAALLAGEALQRTIEAAIARGDLCAVCDGHGGYKGWTCNACEGTGLGEEAEYRETVRAQLAITAREDYELIAAYQEVIGA